MSESRSVLEIGLGLELVRRSTSIQPCCDSMACRQRSSADSIGRLFAMINPAAAVARI